MRTKIYPALIAVLLLGVIAWAKVGSTAQPKQRWEHKIISVPNYVEGAQTLTKLQEDGWELVTVSVWQDVAGGAGLYYLKREK